MIPSNFSLTCNMIFNTVFLCIARGKILKYDAIYIFAQNNANNINSNVEMLNNSTWNGSDSMLLVYFRLLQILYSTQNNLNVVVMCDSLSSRSSSAGTKMISNDRWKYFREYFYSSSYWIAFVFLFFVYTFL